MKMRGRLHAVGETYSSNEIGEWISPGGDLNDMTKNKPITAIEPQDSRPCSVTDFCTFDQQCKWQSSASLNNNKKAKSSLCLII
jgi:hypothetical protein